MGKSKFYILLTVLITISLFSTSAILGQCSNSMKEEIFTEEIENESNEISTEEIGPELEEEIDATEVIPINIKEVFEIIIEEKDYLILDVRTPEEYAEGHLEGAKLIPVSELEDKLNEIPKDKPVVVYCRSGRRSATAADILVENGFSQVYDMGGIIDWQEKGYPIIVEKKTVKEFNTITVDEAYKIFISTQDYLFIDVRSEDEYKSGHIEGAIHIPVSEIKNRLDELPIDRPIIVYCNGSGCDRSGRAAKILTENGFTQVYDMVGLGIFEWEEKGYPIIKE